MISTATAKPQLGELLLQQGLISADQLAIATAEQRQSGASMARTLVRLGFLSDAALRDVAQRTTGVPSIDITHALPDPDAVRLLPQDFAKRCRVLALAYDAGSNVLTVGVTDGFNAAAMDQLRAMLGPRMEVKIQFVAEAQLEDQIDRFYGYELTLDGIVKEMETGEATYDAVAMGADEYTHPMVRLVNALLAEAVKRGASDVHIEPEAGFLRVRYRIDGVLETIRTLHKAHLPGITVRLKVMCGMNIAETRAPQDGRCSLTVQGRPVDFRASSQPTMYGENLVLRVLDREKSVIGLEQMALTPDARARLSVMLARPEGILIVTGPTGSGKTTTLYSLLARVNDEKVNIMTLEDPVEYPLKLLRQTSVNEVARMDFADGIRSIMRQDPDIILVGEIRDRESAEMAFRAAMTGHQVFTTLHANSALGSFSRLHDIGVRPDIMAGNIIGVISQRLVRILCPECRIACVPTPDEQTLLDAHGVQAERIYRPLGCAACRHKGYSGRAPIMELVVMDADMDELIARGATPKELRTHALAKGYRSLAEVGLQRAAEGLTSLHELGRTVDLTGRHCS
jgi:type II secretory ATPase GspE/PulE/Tfp pilus assembly ATPase PilB-like protein